MGKKPKRQRQTAIRDMAPRHQDRRIIHPAPPQRTPEEYEAYIRQKASEVAERVRTELRNARLEGREPKLIAAPAPPGWEDVWREALEKVYREEGYDL